ncbi:MAG: GNAT family N-acetyltransferase [Nitriliruptorales bacterium]|nr:GNAT family N-acetyltransferase [Nitriliruptorales bacterium]
MPDDWPARPLRWPPQPLTDGVVVLDRMTRRDLPTLVGAIDDHILRWLPLPSPYTHVDAIAFLEWQQEMADRGVTLNFAVRTEAGGPLVGSAGLHFRNGPRVAEVGYWITAPARGRGLAARAMRLLAGLAFDHYDARRLEALILPDNTASRRAAERAGAVYEGVRRHGLEARGEPFDAAVYSLLPSDLRTPMKTDAGYL